MIFSLNAVNAADYARMMQVKPALFDKVLENIRRNRPDPLPVIMITANEGSRHKAYAEMLGVHDYLRKPFSIDKLLESVERALHTA